MYVFARDALRTTVEAATGGMVTVLYDAQNNPHYMRVLPRFRYEDLGFQADLGTGWCTAFENGGMALSELFVGLYQANAAAPSGDPADGVVSLPRLAPTSMTLSQARAAAAAMGTHWHVMSIHEWSAVVLWMIAHERLALYDGPGNGVFASVTDPTANRHSQSVDGIDGLYQGQWVDQVRVVDGRVLCTPDNDWFTAPEDYTAQPAYFDATADSGNPDILSLDVTVNSHSGTPGDDTDSGQTAETAAWLGMTVGAGYTHPQLLKRLLIDPVAALGPTSYFSVRNYGTRAVARGLADLLSLDATWSEAYAAAPARFCWLG